MQGVRLHAVVDACHSGAPSACIPTQDVMPGCAKPLSSNISGQVAWYEVQFASDRSSGLCGKDTVVLDAGSSLNLPFRCKMKGGAPTWKSEYLEGRIRTHKGTAGTGPLCHPSTRYATAGCRGNGLVDAANMQDMCEQLAPCLQAVLPSK